MKDKSSFTIEYEISRKEKTITLYFSKEMIQYMARQYIKAELDNPRAYIKKVGWNITHRIAKSLPQDIKIEEYTPIIEVKTWE